MIKEMEYVYAIYQSGSFSKAAEALYISQPALSATVKRLEHELGTTLFDRSCSPIQLTQAGKFYIQSAEEILSVKKNMTTYFNNLRSLDTGSLNIGTSTFYCCYSLPLHIRPFSELHPGIRISLMESASNAELSQSLKSGKLDLVLTSNSLGFEEYQQQFFQHEHLILAVPAHFEINQRLKKYRLTSKDILSGRHRLADTPAVSLKHFDQIPFISLRQGSDLYGRAFQLFANAGFSPNVFMYLDQIPTTYYMTLYGYGFSIIRDTTLHIVPTPQDTENDVMFYKIDDPLAVREITFYHKNPLYLTPTVKAFLSYTKGTCISHK
ncbi:MAG: LysR family transcriptional regulator [Butyrivibrio sp.]|jgi:DNA-binding transcriptional LysR family regulator|nr:LysR family transcriptional regulator [Butyrivibrio sp.]